MHKTVSDNFPGRAGWTYNDAYDDEPGGTRFLSSTANPDLAECRPFQWEFTLESNPMRLRIEVVDDAMADVLRGMTGAQRLRVGFGLFSSARRMLLCHLRHEHPDWSEQQINLEAARRLSHGAV